MDSGIHRSGRVGRLEVEARLSGLLDSAERAEPDLAVDVRGGEPGGGRMRSCSRLALRPPGDVLVDEPEPGSRPCGGLLSYRRALAAGRRPESVPGAGYGA